MSNNVYISTIIINENLIFVSSVINLIRVRKTIELYWNFNTKKKYESFVSTTFYYKLLNAAAILEKSRYKIETKNIFFNTTTPINWSQKGILWVLRSMKLTPAYWVNLEMFVLYQPEFEHIFHP